MKIVTYFRVSTKKQGRSGLGLESQEQCVNEFATSHKATVVGQYKEIESGKRTDRPELLKALAHARRAKATLVVAKLDRLSRNAAFLLTLQDSGVPLAFCDLPGANEFTIGVMALVAQQERKAISERTVSALQAAKRRGVQLGSARPDHWKGREDARLAGLAKARKVATKSIVERANDAYADLFSTVAEWREDGLTLQGIAQRLNDEGQTTRTGKAWSHVQVMRLLARAAA
jgi:DNA invertase Pin-like site-specific DNA recombinase